MTYPKAYAGVKKLHTAQILNLISAIVGFIAIVVVVIGLAAASSTNEEAILLAIPGLILGLAAGILGIIAYILQIVGLRQAGNDDRAFYTAFIFAIIGLVLSVLSSVFSSLNVANGFGDEIATIFNRFAAIIITIFVIIGVRNLADALGQSKMAASAKSLGIVQAVILALSIITNIVSLFAGNTASMIGGILALIASLLYLVFAIIYLVFLGKAKKMLEKN